MNAAYDILGDSIKRGRFDRGEIDANGAETHRNPFAGGGGGGGFGKGGFGPGAGASGGFAFEDLSDLFGGAFRGGRGPFGGGAPRKAKTRASRWTSISSTPWPASKGV